MSNKQQINRLSPGANAVLYAFLLLFALICLLPMILVVIISFTDEMTMRVNGYSFFPKKLSLGAYGYLWRSRSQLLSSYRVSIIVTLAGTLLTLLILSMYAFVISRKDFKYRNFFSFLIFFTMLFNGGLVPSYIVNTQILGLADTLWILILPLACNGFFLLVLKGFFTGIPASLYESGKIDGASEFRIFFQIVVPLSIPGLGAIGLFSSLGYWNNWFQALLYIESADKTPLQHLLMRIQNNIDFIVNNSHLVTQDMTEIYSTIPNTASRMAMVMLVITPILLAYLFFQQYFKKGLMIGSIKG